MGIASCLSRRFYFFIRVLHLINAIVFSFLLKMVTEIVCTILFSSVFYTNGNARPYRLSAIKFNSVLCVVKNVCQLLSILLVVRVDQNQVTESLFLFYNKNIAKDCKQ